MTPIKNQYVRVIFRNSSHVEGFVEQWSEQKALLRSSDGKSLLIIQDVCADIMAIKVYLEPQPEAQLVEPKVTTEVQRKREIDDDFDAEVCKREENIDQYLRAKTLLELRKLQAEQDRKIIAGKLKDHMPTQVRVPKYELPGFLKKQSAK